MSLEAKEGEYGFYWVFTILNADGTPKDLTGYTVQLRVQREGENTDHFKKACEVIDEVNGKCRYLVEDGDFTEGVYDAELVLTATGVVERTKSFKIYIRKL